MLFFIFYDEQWHRQHLQHTIWRFRKLDIYGACPVEPDKIFQESFNFWRFSWIWSQHFFTVSFNFVLHESFPKQHLKHEISKYFETTTFILRVRLNATYIFQTNPTFFVFLKIRLDDWFNAFSHRAFRIRIELRSRVSPLRERSAAGLRTQGSWYGPRVYLHGVWIMGSRH